MALSEYDKMKTMEKQSTWFLISGAFLVELSVSPLSYLHSDKYTSPKLVKNGLRKPNH